MERRKYWLITTEFPPAFGGGIGTYCYHTAKMLAANDWDVTVFLAGKEATEDVIVHQDGYRLIRFREKRSNVWDFLGYETALAYEFSTIVREFMQKEGVPHVLESQEYNGIAYYILQHKHLNYPLFCDLKVLLTMHAPSFLYFDYNRVPSYQLPYFWIGEMEKWCIQAADELNAPSRFIVEAIRPYFSTPLEKEVHIVPLPYDMQNAGIPKFKDPRENWYFFGKLTLQKGILALLKGYRRLLETGWEKPLSIIGGGDHYFHPENTSMQHWLRKKYAREIGAGQLLFLGSLSPDSWRTLMEEGGVVIVPSVGDNYPYTVIESLSAGQIVLASVKGGQSELIRHEDNGFLFDPSSASDFTAKALLIRDLPVDRIATIRREAVRSVSEKHGYDKVYPLKQRLIEALSQSACDNRLFPYTRDKANSGIPSADPGIPGLLSVVIPYYNMGELVQETLQSILASDYPRIEIIVVDDGSDDPDSISRIGSLQKEYGFVVIRQENMGLSEARNTGARVAKGQYLTFLDADDIVLPNYYSRAITLLKEKSNIYFVGSWIQYFEKNNAIWPAFTPEFPYLLFHNMVHSGGLVYKRAAFLESGWNDPILEYGVEDWDCVISLVKNGWRGVVLPEVLYRYRIRKGSMARKFTKEKLLFSIRHITQKHISIYSIFVSELTALLNANGPGYRIDNPTADRKNYGVLVESIPFLKKGVSYVRKKPLLKKIAFAIFRLIKNKK